MIEEKFVARRDYVCEKDRRNIRIERTEVRDCNWGGFSVKRFIRRSETGAYVDVMSMTPMVGGRKHRLGSVAGESGASRRPSIQQLRVPIDRSKF